MTATSHVTQHLLMAVLFRANAGVAIAPIKGELTSRLGLLPAQ